MHQLMVLRRSLRDSKASQTLRKLLSIPVSLNNAVV